MKFYNYINELDSQNEKKLVEYLKKCLPFINDLFLYGDGHFLYSGRKNLRSDYIVKSVRQDRKPLDTGKGDHKILDDSFYEKFGIRARSKTLFCTSNWSNAINYGELYYIFPIGKYEIIWSKTIFDLYRYSKFKEIQGDESKIKNIVNDYKQGDLGGALKSGNEIMLHCKEYLAVRRSSITPDKLWMILRDL